MSVAAVRLLGETREDDRKSLLAGLACLIAGTAVFLLLLPSFLAGELTYSPLSLVWWASVIGISTGLAFLARLRTNNRLRNGMYEMLFYEDVISAKNMPVPLLWRAVCANRRVEYSEERLISFLGLWRNGLADAGRDSLSFTPMAWFSMLTLAEELGIAQVMDAICAGVPVEDVLA